MFSTSTWNANLLHSTTTSFATFFLLLCFICGILLSVNKINLIEECGEFMCCDFSNLRVWFTCVSKMWILNEVAHENSIEHSHNFNLQSRLKTRTTPHIRKFLVISVMKNSLLECVTSCFYISTANSSDDKNKWDFVSLSLFLMRWATFIADNSREY